MVAHPRALITLRWMARMTSRRNERSRYLPESYIRGIGNARIEEYHLISIPLESLHQPPPILQSLSRPPAQLNQHAFLHHLRSHPRRCRHCLRWLRHPHEARQLHRCHRAERCFCCRRQQGPGHALQPRLHCSPAVLHFPRHPSRPHRRPHPEAAGR